MTTQLPSGFKLDQPIDGGLPPGFTPDLPSGFTLDSLPAAEAEPAWPTDERGQRWKAEYEEMQRGARGGDPVPLTPLQQYLKKSEASLNWLMADQIKKWDALPAERRKSILDARAKEDAYQAELDVRGHTGTGGPQPGDPGILRVPPRDMMHPYEVEKRRSRTWGQTFAAIGPAAARTMAKLYRAIPEAVMVPEVKDAAAQQLDQWAMRHGELSIERAESIGDLVTSPKKMVGMVVETAPYMAGVAAAYAAGGPPAAFMFAFAIEGQTAHDDAIVAGASPEEANQAKLIHGTIAATLEGAQIGQLFRFAKSGTKPLQNAVAKRVSLKLTQQGLAGRAANEVLQAVPFLVREGVEETLQGTSQELTALGVYGEPISAGFLDRRILDFAGGALAYGVFGVGARGIRVGTQALKTGKAAAEQRAAVDVREKAQAWIMEKLVTEEKARAWVAEKLAAPDAEVDQDVPPLPEEPPGTPKPGFAGDEEGALPLSGMSNLLKGTVNTVARLTNDLMGEMAVSVSDTLAGRALVRVLDRVSTRAASLVGPIENMAADAHRGMTGKDRHWMAAESKGYGNFQRLVEDTPLGTLETPSPGVQAVVDAYTNMLAATGLEAERIGIQVVLPDGKVIPFRRALSGRHLRTWTPDAYHALTRGDGPLFEAIADAVASEPGNEVTPHKARTFLREWLGPEAVRKIGQLENLRAIKHLPIVVEVNGSRIAIQEADPIRAIIRHAQRQARRIYMIEAIGQGFKKGAKKGAKQKAITLLDRLRDLHVRAGGRQGDFDEIISVFEGRRWSGFLKGFRDPRNPINRALRSFDTLIATSQTSMSAIPNLPQTMILLPKYVGLTNYVKAIAEVLRHPRTSVAQMTAIGAMNRSIIDWTIRQGHKPEDLSNIIRGLVARGTGLEALSQFNNAVAGVGFRRLADYWRQHGLPDRDLAVTRDLQLTQREVRAVQNGKMTPEIYRKIIQNGVKITQFITEDPHRMAKFQHIPLLNGLFAYNNYAIGSIKAIARTVRESATAAMGGTASQRGTAAYRLVLLLMGLSGAGSIALLLRRAAKGQEIVRPDEEMQDILVRGLWESAILGPTQRVSDAFEYGGTTERAVVGLSPKIAAGVELLKALRGDGTWGEMPLGTRMGKAATKLSPLARGLENWYQRLKYPQKTIYGKVRSLAGVYAKDILQKERTKVRGAPINPQYYGVHQAILEDDPETMKAALDVYNEWAKEQGWDDEEARSHLRSALASRRPVNFNFATYREFIQSLPPEKRQMVAEAQAHYTEALDQVTLTEAEIDAQQGDFETLKRQVTRGEISGAEARRIVRRSAVAALAQQVSDLTAEDALRVWTTASPEEKEELRPVLFKKIKSYGQQETKTKFNAMAARYRIAGVLK